MASASGASGIAATIERLATLQNLVKRDPEAYREEFALQHQHYLAELEILKLNPAAPAESFTALVHFLAHVCACYKKETGEFPGQLMDLLSSHAELLVPEVRRGVAQALILMRNRDVVEALPLHRLFFSLFRLKDRQLRELLQTHIIHDIRNINQVKRDEGTNRAVQSLIYSMMTDASPQAAHRSLNVLVELYRRHVWQDARSVNAIAAALLSPHSKLLITALNFFLGVGSNGATDVDDEDGGDDDSDSDGEIQEASLDARTLRRALATHAHSKHTKRRARQTERMIAGLKKNVRKAAEKAGPVFPAIQLIHDPQGIAERLFGRLRTAGEKFEVRLLMMNLISRLIGQHRLLVLPFYSFVQRYLKAHQAHVTQVLAYLVQACHDLVPPDEVLPVLRSITMHFISDGCTPEVLQVGLNAFREVVAHCPVVLEEEGMRDLVQDLVQYKKYRNKGVVASARALLNLIRDIFPALLRKRDWGRDVAVAGGAAHTRPTSYGYQLVATGIEGADLLALVLARKAQKRAAAAAAAAALAEGEEAAMSEDDDDEEEASDDEDEDDQDEDGNMALDGPTRKHRAAARTRGGSIASGSTAKAASTLSGDTGGRKRAASRAAAAAAAAAAVVTPAQIAAVEDEDEWAAVARAHKAALMRAHKPLPADVKEASRKRKAARTAAAKSGDAPQDADADAEAVGGMLGDSDEEEGHGHGHGHSHGHDESHKNHHHHADGRCCADEHGSSDEEEEEEEGSDDSDDADGESGSDSEASDNEGEDSDEEEEEEEPASAGVGLKRRRPGSSEPAGKAAAGPRGKVAAAAAAAGSKAAKRRRLEAVPEAADSDAEEAEEEEASSEEEEEEHEAASLASSRLSGGAGGKAAVATALAASMAPLLSGGGNGKKKGGKGAASSSSASSSAAAAAPASEFRPFQLEAERLLTPKDFQRIRTIRARLAEKGFNDAKARDVLRAMLESSGAAAAAPSSAAARRSGVIDAAELPPSVAAILDEGFSSDEEEAEEEDVDSGSEDGSEVDSDEEDEEDGEEGDSDAEDEEAEEGASSAAGADGAAAGAGGSAAKAKRRQSDEGAKRKRRGGRNLGYAPDEKPDDSDAESSDGENQLAMPGTVYYAPVTAVDPRMLESDMTRKKRRNAERLAQTLTEKQAKYEGKKAGGGLTNKEKARKKNFLMLRKSGTVQLKMKQSLVASQKAVRARLSSKNNLDKRKKQRRRRT